MTINSIFMEILIFGVSPFSMAKLFENDPGDSIRPQHSKLLMMQNEHELLPQLATIISGNPGF